MSAVLQYELPVKSRPAPWLARKTAPMGPPGSVVTELEGVRVVTVPGLYCVSHIIEGPERLIIADVGSSTDIPYLESAVNWLGKPVAYVVPTHLHFDHIMGIDATARHFGASVALSPAAWDLVTNRRRLRYPGLRTVHHFFRPWVWQGLPGAQKADIPGCFDFGFPWSRHCFTSPLVRLDYDEDITLTSGWTVLDTPGHSDECNCLWHAGAGFLVCGDTISGFEGGEWDALITDRSRYRETAERLKKLKVSAFFFGHGPVQTGTDMMSAVTDKYKVLA